LIASVANAFSSAFFTSTTTRASIPFSRSFLIELSSFFVPSAFNGSSFAIVPSLLFLHTSVPKGSAVLYPSRFAPVSIVDGSPAFVRSAVRHYPSFASPSSSFSRVPIPFVPSLSVSCLSSPSMFHPLVSSISDSPAFSLFSPTGDASTSSNSSGLIVGIVVGILALIALAVVFFILRLRLHSESDSYGPDSPRGSELPSTSTPGFDLLTQVNPATMETISIYTDSGRDGLFLFME
jgi:hypothetical protein